METSGIALSGYTLYFAAVAAFASAALYLVAIFRKKDIPAARFAYVTAALFITLAMVFLTYHLLTRDFRLSYVTSYSSSDLSFMYTISALWAGQEGSFLFWTFCALLLGLFLLKGLGDLENLVMFFYTLPVAGLLILLIKQSPFLVLAHPLAEGKGLNPLLQNPWMAIHPPAMFVGYAAYGIPFAFALALAVRKEFHRFVRISYTWVIFAWVSMGIGIILGGFWAYETLGWGGFWGWDPVENASLIPWLTLSALLHGMVIQRKFGGFFKSNYLLTVISFIFILYGTFLTRSGVLQDFSVHSFVDLGITGLLLFVLFFFIALSLGIYIWKFRGFPAGEKIKSAVNAPFFLTLSTMLLLASAFFVTLGTSSPILTKFMEHPSKVGNDFYIRTSIPVYLILMAIMAVCPLFYIKAKRRMIYIFGALSLGIVLLSAALGVHNILHLLILLVCAFAFLSQWLWIRKMEIGFIHAGLALFIMGSVYSTGYDTKEKLTLTQGKPVTWAGYVITLKGFQEPRDGKSFLDLDMVQGGRIHHGIPKLWENPRTRQLVANPDIQKGLLSDIYLAAEQYTPPGGVGDQMVFLKGKPETVGPFELTFTGFQFAGSHQQGGPMELFCLFDVKAYSKTWQIKPKFSPAEGAGAEPVRLGETGSQSVRVMKVNADTKQVILAVSGSSEAGKATAVVEAMKIPMINLVWLGTILAIAGGCWSLIRHVRRRGVGSTGETGEKSEKG